jgi:hypothetical protein
MEPRVHEQYVDRFGRSGRFGFRGAERLSAQSAKSAQSQLKPVCKALDLTGVNWHWFRHACYVARLGPRTHWRNPALHGHSSSEITLGDAHSLGPGKTRVKLLKTRKT